jgi:hypothetical protein
MICFASEADHYAQHDNGWEFQRGLAAEIFAAEIFKELFGGFA